MKIRIGILFGGSSREREISFAGGRTVYDNLNKALFEPLPLFVDSFGNLVELNWEFIYKGSIRDFYPPAEVIPSHGKEFQVYAESLADKQNTDALINPLGTKIQWQDLPGKIDFAFLCLHGSDGEDGRMQGLLEYLRIPYSGSGIFASAFGMNKALQKRLMLDAGFDTPDFVTIQRNEWLKKNQQLILEALKKKISFPLIVKSANQGSSIGATVLKSGETNLLKQAIDKSFFIREIQSSEWNNLNDANKISLLRSLADIREGIGMPVKLTAQSKHELIKHPSELLDRLNYFASKTDRILLEGTDSEQSVVIEQFIDGSEFSCIVLRNMDGMPVALPPTEIRKGNELFDYRSKYLPGLSRKITPIDLPDADIEKIRTECERLFTHFNFSTYARIDGFITPGKRIFLNDPNTTSGMMPSSFFFHQAAEIGLNPSQFLTFIIHTSVRERMADMKNVDALPKLLSQLDNAVAASKKESGDRIKVAVILGGYSSERHISVESGRNVFEKLSSSEKYEPVPIFLAGNADNHQLFKIPINLLLKDNADDISDKVKTYRVHPVIDNIILRCSSIRNTFCTDSVVMKPGQVTYQQLAQEFQQAFIALHGRPGEDGAVQQELDKVGVTYNGSNAATSQLTINKYETNELLRKNGLLVAEHLLVSRKSWLNDKETTIDGIERIFNYPFIAKPVDDGCSSAVKKILKKEQLIAFAEGIFRHTDQLTETQRNSLNLKPNEEFPAKHQFLVEELIQRKDARHFFEITGGLLTHIGSKNDFRIEIFEASEALSEGDVLSLEEKFLAGQGQNITPARYDTNPELRQLLSDKVKSQFLRAAKLLNIEGYARIDAFVRIFNDDSVEVIFIEVNSLPGMTPATCIFHQAAIAGYKPYEFIDKILSYARQSKKKKEMIIP